jgi:putative drug exporter of the RND superfamily
LTPHECQARELTIACVASAIVTPDVCGATKATIDMKEMGVGLAAPILIDATVVGAVLLPATMRLLGERGW